MKRLVFAAALAIFASAPFAASAGEIIVPRHDAYSASSNVVDVDWRHRDHHRAWDRHHDWRHKHHRRVCETKRVTHWRHHHRVVERITVCR